MKDLHPSALVLILALVVSGCSLFSPPSPPPPSSDPIALLLSADSDMKEQVRRAMARAAERAGISIQLSNLVYLSRDDLTVAHALVVDFDSLRLLEPNRVGDVGLAFLSLPASVGVPTGFYKIRIFVLEAKAELLDAQGGVVAVFPLERAQETPGSRPLISVTNCRVTLIYQQVSQGVPPIQAAVPLDWCKPVGPL